MAAPTPATDPNFAWDTQGWTNQGNTGDVEGLNPVPATGLNATSLTDPSALSTYAFKTMDPDQVTSAGSGVAATATAYFGAFVVDTPTVSTKGVVGLDTNAGTITHSYYALVDAGGNTQAATADSNATLSGATGSQPVAWASTSLFYNSGISAIIVPPGLYFFVFAATWTTSGPSLSGVSAKGALLINGPASGVANTPASGLFPRFTSQAATITSSFPASFTLSSNAKSSVAFFGAGY